MIKKERLITTISNEVLPRQLCRYIQGKWYKIGDSNIVGSGDCYLIFNKYYRSTNSKFITYDYGIKQYNLLSNTSYDIIIGISSKGQILYGKTSTLIPFKYNIQLIPGGSLKKYYLNDDNIIKNNRLFREDITTGIFKYYQSQDMHLFTIIRTISDEFKRSLDYNVPEKVNSIKIQGERVYNPKIEIDNKIIEFSKLLGKYSFGIEFETIKGNIPERLTYKNNIIPLRDGSVNGLEYATLPLFGKVGVESLLNTCKVLQDRTKYNESCSIHFHIGNVPRTPEFVLALFILSAFLEKDMYSLFPLYKQYNFGVKRKNYTAPLPSLDLLRRLDPVINKSNFLKNFDKVFRFLSQGEPFNSYNNSFTNINNHPMDVNNRHKWNISTRYHWINFIPLIFTNKQTIEFRIHTPTFNQDKILYFLAINTLLIKFAEENTTKILENNVGLMSSLHNIIDIEVSKIFTTKNDIYSLRKKLKYYIEDRRYAIYNTNSKQTINFTESSIRLKRDNKLFTINSLLSKGEETKQKNLYNEINIRGTSRGEFISSTPPPILNHNRSRRAADVFREAVLSEANNTVNSWNTFETSNASIQGSVRANINSVEENVVSF